MLLSRIDPQHPDAATLKKAVGVLKRGGLVVYPTETAYALGCDPQNTSAVKKLFALKKRDASKPLPLIAATPTMARRFVRLDRYASMLVSAFWPGPLTLVAAKRRVLAPGVASRAGEYAVRVSAHPVALALAKALGRPIVSTSANLSGREAPYAVPDVLCDLGPRVDQVIDAGRLPTRPPSTVVRAQDGIVLILREGTITEDDLHAALMKRL